MSLQQIDYETAEKYISCLLHDNGLSPIANDELRRMVHHRIAEQLGVSEDLIYEAAKIDGAGKFRQLTSVTLPCLLPTIVVMLILQVGKSFNVGYEKILLMYNPLTYEVADVISTYVYREGLLNMNWSYSTAVGLFNSVVSFALVWATNKISQKVSGSGLW